MNILTDFLLALLPVPLIWQLQLNLRTRISLILVLSLGLFACVAGVMKVRLNKTILSDPNRFIFDGYSMWNFIELDVGIIAGSLPAIKPLLSRFLNAARGFTSDPSKCSMPGDRKTTGYYRHESEHEISLVDYGRSGVTAVEISAQTPSSRDKAVWGLNRASSSEDSISPQSDMGSTSKVIVVTKDVHIS